MHVVTLGKQQLRKIGTVLPGDARNQGNATTTGPAARRVAAQVGATRTFAFSKTVALTLALAGIFGTNYVGVMHDAHDRIVLQRGARVQREAEREDMAAAHNTCAACVTDVPDARRAGRCLREHLVRRVLVTADPPPWDLPSGESVTVVVECLEHCTSSYLFRSP